MNASCMKVARHNYSAVRKGRSLRQPRRYLQGINPDTGGIARRFRGTCKQVLYPAGLVSVHASTLHCRESIPQSFLNYMHYLWGPSAYVKKGNT